LSGLQHIAEAEAEAELEGDAGSDSGSNDAALPGDAENGEGGESA
jgi:DNA gyrase subunit A